MIIKWANFAINVIAMIKLYLKTALLSIIGFLLTNTTAVPMDRFIQDDEMPDNYKGIELEEEEEYSIVGFSEADPMKLFISNESPIGKAIMGKHEGDEVSAEPPAGVVKCKVISISK